MDFEGAFDNMELPRLWSKLSRKDVTGAPLRLISDLFTGTHGRARLSDGATTRPFNINKGALQGSVIAPTLFNIFLDDLLADLRAHGPTTEIFGANCNARYADDILLVADSAQNLLDLIKRCETWATANAMKFAPDKCSVVIYNEVGRTAFTEKVFTLDGEKLEVGQPDASSERHLGLPLTDYLTDHIQQKDGPIK